MQISALDDKAIHEEDTQQQHHASSISNNNVAGYGGGEAVKGEAKLVAQEQQSPEHEEPAAIACWCNAALMTAFPWDMSTVEVSACERLT